MPSFAPAPPRQERSFDTADDEAFPIELTEECPAEDDEPELPVAQPVVVWDPDRDWYLDATEQQWLTAKEIQQRFPAYRSSTFGDDVVRRNAFGLRTARRKAWKSPAATSGGRRYKVYEYPLWRVKAWVDLDDELPSARASRRDRTETEWLSAAAVEARFGLDRTTFQHAVSRDAAGLRSARRRTTINASRSRREQVFQYPLWRVEMWADVAPTRPIPSLDEVKRFRSERDSAASLLAREVGFSPREVRAAAAIGDLDAGIDPNTSKVLFLPPHSTSQWLQRDSWRRTG